MGRKVKALENYTSEQIKVIIDGDAKHKLGIRIYAVYQSSMGMSSRALVELYNVSFKQIRNWINRFDAEGTHGLLDKARSGRPRKLTENQLYELQSVLLDSPEQHGYNTAKWSAALVKDFISKHYEVEYMLANVYRIMHSLGFSYQKARGFFPERNEQQREQAKTDIKKL